MWLWIDREPGSDARPADRSGPVSVTGVDAGSTSESDSSLGTTRSPVGDQVARVRVTDDFGEPISGARVALIPAVATGHIQRSPSAVPTTAQSSAIWSLSDERGFARFSAGAVEAAAPGVLFGLAPGFEIATLPADALVNAEDTVLRLRTRSLHVQVLSHESAVGSGATVRLQYLASVSQNGVPHEATLEVEFEKFGQEPIVVPYARDSILSCRFIDQESCPVNIEDQAIVSLRLRSTFQVRLEFPSGSRQQSPVQFRLYAIVGGAPVDVQSGLRRALDGALELTVPFLGPYRYVVQCGGDGWASMPQEVRRPRPGGYYVLRFVAAGDRSWSIRVIDQDDQPVSGAAVACEWISGGGERLEITEFSDSRGDVEFHGLPDALVDFWVKKRGMFQSETAGAWTSFPQDHPTLVKMHRGAGLCGTVTLNGSPLREFVVWVSSSGGGWSGKPHLDSPEGRFELSDLPPGPVDVVVTSPTTGQSDQKSLTVEPSSIQTVDFQLSPSERATCTVLDALTGLPISTAQGEVLVYAGGIAVGSTGARFHANGDGRIDFDGLQFGTCRVAVEAPGYERVVVSGFLSQDDKLDLGVVRLRGTASLEVRVEPDGPMKIEWCSVAIVGAMTAPRVLLDPSGRASFGSVAPGRNRIEITRVDASEDVVTVDISDREPNILVVPISVNRTTRVEIDPAIVSRVVGVEIFHTTRAEMRRSTFTQSAGKQVVLVPVDPSCAQEIELTDLNGVRLARREVTEAERAGGVIVVGSAGHLIVRVQTRSRHGLQGCSVLVRRAGGDPEAIVSMRTDSEGVADAPGVAWDVVDVLVFHPQIGVRPSERVDLKELAGRTLELELNPVGRARVAVKDREVAIAGVQVRFLDPKYNAGRAMTDEEGVAWSLPLQEGKYRAEVGQSGYWPAVLDFECDKEEVWTTLQVRRTGGLDLEIQSASARDPRSFLIELRSKEFETPVSTWLGAGKVVSPQGGRPDKDGRLEIYGLPNGEYAWTAILDGAGVMAGEIEVGPHTVNKKKLFLP